MLEYFTLKIDNSGYNFICIFVKMEWARFDQSIVDTAISQ